MKIAVYPGSFDPLTNGHLDLIERAAKIFDRLIVAVADNPGKSALFNTKERIEMLEKAVEKLDNVSIESISGLTVDYVEKKGASVIVRGLRAISDFEYELQMALMNRKLNDRIETVFLMPNLQYSYVKSSHVKEVAKLGGCLKGLAPEFVIEKLRQKFSNSK